MQLHSCCKGNPAALKYVRRSISGQGNMGAASAFCPYQAPLRLEETQAVCPGPCNIALQSSVGLRALQGDPLLRHSVLSTGALAWHTRNATRMLCSLERKRALTTGSMMAVQAETAERKQHLPCRAPTARSETGA